MITIFLKFQLGNFSGGFLVCPFEQLGDTVARFVARLVCSFLAMSDGVERIRDCEEAGRAWKAYSGIPELGLFALKSAVSV